MLEQDDVIEATKVESDFESFFRTTEPALSRALPAGFGFDLGHDATVEALTYAWRNWERVARLDNPAGYLFRVGERWAKKQRARLRRSEAFAAPAAHAEPAFEPTLAPALVGLPRRQRQVVVLVSGFGMSHAEAASLLGISRTSVQNHQERGLAKLRNALVRSRTVMIDQKIRTLFEERTRTVHLDDVLHRADAPVPHRAARRWVPAGIAAGILALGGVGLIAVAGPDGGRQVTPATGASTAQDPTVSAPGTASVVVPATVRYQPGMPIDPTELTQTDEAWNELEHHGFEAAVAACMHDAGFDFIARPFESSPQVGPLRDAEYRRTYGFGYPPVVIDTAAWDRFTAQQADPAWDRAFRGEPDEQAGGCQGVALHQLYPPNGWRVAPRNSEFNDAASGWSQTVAADPQLLAAEATWSRCMTELGRTSDDGTPYQSPIQLLASGPSPHSAGPPSEAEVALALDDWKCQQQVGFVDAWFGRRQQLSAEFADAHRDLIDSIHTWQTDVAERARQAIAAITP